MKNKVNLLIVLLFTCALAHAQQKGCDKIIIKNDKSASDNFLAVKLILAEKGIEIASIDKDIFQLKTGVTPITRYGASAYYVLFCKDNSIQLTGYFNTGLELNTLVKDTDPFKQIVNRRVGLWGESWKAMNSLAQSIGTDIQYLGGYLRPDPKKDDVY